MEKTIQELEHEMAELRWQLEEANDTIEAIRSGQVDALIVNGDDGHQLYTLRSADQTYRVFIEKMMEGAITLNSEGLILYSNSRFAQMMNLPLSEVIGVPFRNFVPASAMYDFNLLINKGWSTESKGEIILSGYNGNAQPSLLSLTTLELNEGLALSVIITDLTSHKENERQLKDKNDQLVSAHNSLASLNNELEFRVEERTHELSLSREHFKFLADQIPVIVYTAQADGTLNYFNRRWYEYTGCDLKEDESDGWLECIHPDERDGVKHAWRNAVATGEEYHIEHRLLRADNTYRWHSAIALPFKNDDGEIVTWFGISTDINEQKVAMTRKDEFISMASHELKTPVTTLKAFTQLLLSIFTKENHNTAVQFLTKMDRQIIKLTTLISDLLDATKVNAGVLHFSEEHFDINELINEVVEQMKLTSETHGIETKLSPPVVLYGDKNRVGQVISNLISNAMKYSPNADKIVLSTDVDNQHVRINVQDFGIGIPQNQHAKLFNRFFRASEVKTNTFPGLGLGLYISNEIVKRHSGQITFTSEEGKGSIFCLELPIVQRTSGS